jgi:peptidoglycan/LPS O-acetylase OafA/YrhL
VFGNRAIVAALVAGGFALCLYSWHGFISSEVFECGMYFFTGGIAQRLYSRPTPISIGAAVIFTILAAWSYAWAGVNPVFLILLAVSVVIAITKVGETFFHKPFSRLAFLGNATYSSYLLHFPIQLFAVILVDYAGLTRSIFYSPVALIAYLSSVFGLSLAVHRYFEMPAQSLLRGMVRFAFSGTSDSGRRSPLKTELSDRPRA